MGDDAMNEIEARKSLDDFAALIRHYYLSLLAEGFTADQALVIATAWQAQVQRGNSE